MREALERVWALLGHVPVTVTVVVGVSWLFLASGLDGGQVDHSVVTLLNPLWYVTSMFVHADAAHFQGNVTLIVPFGVVLTLFTSNRHVLLVMVVPHVLGNILRVVVAPAFAYGASGAAFALVAATLVRSAGYAMDNASTESLGTVLVGLLTPFLLFFLLIAIVAGASPIAHFIHFFAFLFGGATEAMYVLGEHDDGEDERRVPDRLGLG